MIIRALAIAALFSALLVPATPVRAQAEAAASCEANLKRLYEAIESYRKDHDGAYPLLSSKTDDGRLVLWPELIKPYLNDSSPADRVDVNGPLFSPAVPMADRRGGRASNVSYGYNRYALGADGGAKGRQAVKAVPHPERTILLVECDAPKPPGIGWYAAYPNEGIDFAVHDGKAHVLFCDGHIEHLAPEELNVGKTPNTNSAPWFGDLSKPGGNAAASPPFVDEPAKPAADREKPAAAVAAATPVAPGAIDENLPLVSIAHAEAAPAIDGKLSPGEWDKLTAFGGFRVLLTGLLANRDVVTMLGYDDQALYACYVLPLKPGERPTSRVMEKDGPVYRDDAVEIILVPGEGAERRHVVVNSAGVVFDGLGGNRAFNGDWAIAVGEATDGPQPYWFVEMKLPFDQMQLPVQPKPGDVWRGNFCVDGSQQLTFIPSTKSYLEAERYAYMRFQGPGEPVVHMAGLGKPTYGQLHLAGAIHNGADAAAPLRIAAMAEKEGTRIVERTGFDEIEGARVQDERKVSVAPGASEAIDFKLAMEDTRLDRLNVEVQTLDDATGKPAGALYRNKFEFSVLPPLRLEVQNYPTNRKLLLQLDAAGLPGEIAGVQAVWNVLDDAGNSLLSQQQPLGSRSATIAVDTTPLKPGRYTMKLDLLRDGEPTPLTSQSKAFARAGEPEWLTADIGSSPRILQPFTPLVYGEREISMWGRRLSFDSGSLLPSRISGAEQELLSTPARLIVSAGGKDHVVTLDRFAFKKQDADRGEFELSGDAGPSIVVSGTGWVEYDGLAWFDLTVAGKDGRDIDVSAVRIELAMPRQHATHYHAVPDRSITGAIGSEPMEIPWQYYLWLGTPDRGLGFIAESQRNWNLGGSTVYRIVPRGDDEVLWQIQLVDRPTKAKSLRYAFGLQATPVKALPSGISSWLVEHFDRAPKSTYSRFTQDMDLASIWNNRPMYMPAICDPMGVEKENLSPRVAEARAVGVKSVPYFAPFSYTDGVRQEHEDYAWEWAQFSITKWTSTGTVQTRTCVNSTWGQFLLYAMRRTVTENDTDGIYFDGALPLPCTNEEHGCGWRDAKGHLQPTIPVLAMRQFMKRVAVMVEEHVASRAGGSAASDPYPQSFIWTHISGAVCPPILSFNTMFLSGEWFKFPIREGRGYEDLLSLDTFRPRYLSDPWGIPNAFLSITLDPQKGTTAQTETILAYLLTHNIPLFPRYLDLDIRERVIGSMIEFGARHATYTPSWRDNPVLQLDRGVNPNLLVATWQKDGKTLAVVANVGKQPGSGKLAVRGEGTQSVRTIFGDPSGIDALAGGSAATFEIGPNTFWMFQLEPR